MTDAQLNYLRAREIETFFFEKVSLEYRGRGGTQNLYSEFEVTRVNDRPVRVPISIGYCQLPNGASLYIEADLTKEKQGKAKIEFDLLPEKLSNLRKNEDNIMFFEALQSSIADRNVANAEDISGQSFWMFTKREFEKTFEHPLKQIKEYAKEVFSPVFPRFIKTVYSDSVVQGQTKHFRSGHSFVAPNSSLKNSIKEYLSFPDEPIIVRFNEFNRNLGLNADVDYMLSFSESSRAGGVRRMCDFDSVGSSASSETATIEYEGMYLTDSGVVFQLDSEDCISVLFAEPEIERSNEKDSDFKQNNDFEDLAPDEEFIPDVVPAETLPEGWSWRMFNDGSGGLMSPGGNDYFSYDRQPYSTSGGIEYKKRNDSQWDVFWGSFDDFKSHAENVISKEFSYLGKHNIPEIMSELSNNAWYGKEPTTVRFKSGDNVIEIEGYTYEPSYEYFSATSSISLNGQILFGQDSRNVEAYRNEVYMTGIYNSLHDAVSHIREKIESQNLILDSDKKDSLNSVIFAAEQKALKDSKKVEKPFAIER